MSFGSLMRIGETTKARRSDLVFPSDALGAQDFIIKINEPKTRGRAAKHQAAKVLATDLIAIIRLAFKELPKFTRLWPHSDQTLRKGLIKS